MPELESVTLRDPSSSLTATYVPVAGMICTSLADHGVEILGQRRGLNAYVTNGKTMGIPILYPWANRLSANNYGIDGAVVSLTSGDRRCARRRTRPPHPRRARGLSRLAGHRQVGEYVDGRSRLRRECPVCWRLSPFPMC